MVLKDITWTLTVTDAELFLIRQALQHEAATCPLPDHARAAERALANLPAPKATAEQFAAGLAGSDERPADSGPS